MPAKTIRSVINGQEVSSPLAPFNKIYPATGEVIAKIEPATTPMLDDAVRHAAEAQREWAAMAGHERAHICLLYTSPSPRDS